MLTTKKSPPSPWITSPTPKARALDYCRWRQRPVTIGEVALHVGLSLVRAERLLDDMAHDNELVKEDGQTPRFRCRG